MPARQKPAARAPSNRARADEFVAKLAGVLSSQSNVKWTKAKVSKVFTASLAELPESRQRRELQADTARFVSLLYAELRDGTQHVIPPEQQRPSKRRRTAAADMLPANQDAATEEDTHAVLRLLLDSEYDTRVSQVSVDPERAGSAELAVLLRARLPPSHELLVKAVTAYADIGAENFVDFTPQRSLAVADRLIALSSALSSSPHADPAHATTCFRPALRSLSMLQYQCRDMEWDSDGADYLQSAAALVARLFAVLAVRQRTLRLDTTRLARDDEQLLAALVACRADFRLVQLQGCVQAAKGSDASRARTPSAAGEGPAAAAAAALAAAEDARTLLDTRAAAALTEFLISEPQPAAAGSDRQSQLWLTLHAAIALLRLQDPADFLSSVLLAKMAADMLKEAGQHHRAQRAIADTSRLQPSPSVLAWLRGQPPSEAITGILAKVEGDPLRLAAQLLSSAPVKTLRALQRAHSAAGPTMGTDGGTQKGNQPGSQGDQAADDELLFVMEKAGDPQAASLWAEDADGAASGSEDDVATLRDGSGAGDSSEGVDDST